MKRSPRAFLTMRKLNTNVLVQHLAGDEEIINSSIRNRKPRFSRHIKKFEGLKH